MDKTLDTGLISRSLSFHGAQLRKIWENERGEGDLRRLGVDNVEFTQVQQNNKLISYQDRGRRLKLHQFICRQANVLFDEVLNVRTESSQPLPNPSHHYAVLPPYEMFAGVEKKDRLKNFFSGLKQGDLVFGPLMAKINNGFIMKVFCSEGEANRICADLGVKAVIHTGNMIGCVDKKNITRSFNINDIVCCEVLEVSSVSEKIFAGMKGESCPASVRHRLGLTHAEDLPSFLKMWQEGMKPYDEMLQGSVGFHNPGSTKVLSEQLGLGNENYSNFSALRFGFPTEERAGELKQAQSAKWAYKSVSDGIALFKANKHAEAFLCLNKALSIDPNNVEALVARGALSANGGNFKKAIEDFECAMKINSSHQNARKYLAETLVAYGRSFEEEEKWEDAVGCYERCLLVNPLHKEAKNSIEYVKSKIGMLAVEQETIPLLPPGKAHGVKETLKQLLASQEKKKKKKKEKKAKKKKNRSRSSSSSSSASSSSTSSSSSSSSSTSTASSQDSHHKQTSRKQKRKSEKDKSLSPISKRMALMDSALLESGHDAEMQNKATHSNNPPPSLPFTYNRPEGLVGYDSFAAVTLLKQAAAQQEADEYEMRVKKFLEQTKGDDDYEEKVKKFLEETSRRKKDKTKDDKKKKKKKDKKGKKKKKEERRKLKKAAKEEKLRREGKRRRSESNIEEEDYQPKFDLSHLVNNFNSLPDLEDLQNKLSAYYAKMPAKSRKESSEKIVKTPKKDIAEERPMMPKGIPSSAERELPKRSKKDLDMFESSPSPPKRRSTSSSSSERRKSPPPTSSKFKMQINSKANKKKDKFEDTHTERWEDHEDKVIDIKDVEPPPLPPTKDEMAMNLKKIVDKKKEEGGKQPNAVMTGASVMDKLGGFRINPAAVMADKRRSRSGSDSDDSSIRRSRRSSRSNSGPPRRRPTDSSDRDSRSRSSSYPRLRRYHSSDTGSDRSRSRSYSHSRSRSRSFRSRSRSDDRYHRNRYNNNNRGMHRNRGTYYKPRFQGGFKRGFNRGGYNNNRRGGFRDYRNRGGYNNRGYNNNRGGRGRGGPRYFDYRNRQHNDRNYNNRRYDRNSRSDEDSPMRKVDAAKERIDKLINQPGRASSDPEENPSDYAAAPLPVNID